MRVPPGVRVGLWRETGWKVSPFFHLGNYVGPDLGDPIVGARFTQELIEGTLEFTVNVLYRPDLGKRQRLETVLVLAREIPEMWDYDTWEQKSLSPAQS